MIYEIRGKQVMLDSDLARLYKILTGNLNKAVKRNMERFPDNFMFQLIEIEYKNLMFQIGISNKIFVKRNIERFPEDFCFQIAKDEYHEILRCHFGTLDLKQGKFSNMYLQKQEYLCFLLYYIVKLLLM